MTKPILVDARALAQMLSISEKTVRRMDATGKLPRPVRVSARSIRWRRADIERWADQGCPPRHEFEAFRKSPA